MVTRMTRHCQACFAALCIIAKLLHRAQRNVPDPLKLYTRVRGVGWVFLNPCEKCCTGFPMCSTRCATQAGPFDPVIAGKYFLNPNAVGSLTPHTADMLPGAGPSVEVPSSCAYIAHLVNLIHPRHTKEHDYFDKSNTWWWIRSENELQYARR